MTTLKQQFSSRQATVGSWLMLGHPEVAEIMAAAGFDWLVVDLEHSAITEREAEDLFRAIELKGSTPLVRLTSNDSNQIKRMLDIGAQGIIVPMVKTADDARKAVAAAHYPPDGIRSFALSRAQGYGPSFDSYVSDAKDLIVVIAIIEHVDAIKNLPEILAVDGLDGTMIGPYDLSGSIGKPGQLDDPEVIELVQQYATLSQEVGKTYGFHVVDTNYDAVQAKLNEGFGFVAFSTDTLFIGTTARAQMRFHEKRMRKAQK